MEKATIPKKYALNWEYLDMAKDQEMLDALSYLIEAMMISVSQEVYNQLRPEAKKYFKLV